VAGKSSNKARRNTFTDNCALLIDEADLISKNLRKVLSRQIVSKKEVFIAAPCM